DGEVAASGRFGCDRRVDANDVAGPRIDSEPGRVDAYHVGRRGSNPKLVRGSPVRPALAGSRPSDVERDAGTRERPPGSAGSEVRIGHAIAPVALLPIVHGGERERSGAAASAAFGVDANADDSGVDARRDDTRDLVARLR